MPRVIFRDGEQSKFIEKIKEVSELNNRELAFLCGINERTFRDWVRGKYSISEKALDILIEKYNLSLPENIQIVEDYWYATKGARKGALKRLELYGSPGTFEGRIKGGKNSQLRRRENPEKYRLLGCNVKKEFTVKKPSVKFAEIVGIMLGDGAISNYQARITVSSLVDRQYAVFITKLFQWVFKEKPSWGEYGNDHTIEISLSGVGLVEELERWGMKRGDKVRNQVSFPAWIWQDIEFQKACVRGLMDTDGGCYFHKHKVTGLTYRHFGMCFSNKSLPIVQGVAKVLKSLGVTFSVTQKGTRIYIYNIKEIAKYFELIGSDNPKNSVKLKCYLAEKTHRIL